MSDIVNKFSGKRILVLGDLMLDKYIWGDVVRISPEAPVPVVEVKEDSACLGGGGNVYHNLERLGSNPMMVGVVGNDSEGDWIKEKIGNGRGVFVCEQRPTTMKTRIIAHQQQVVRVDIEKKNPFSREMVNKMKDVIKENKSDGILISDYNKGVVSRALMEEILPYAQNNKIPVFVDPKVENFPLYSPVQLITPNHLEAARIVQQNCDTNEEVERAGALIMSSISARFLIIKRGERGMSVFDDGGKRYHIPARAKEVYDVTGAGDTVIATAALALLSGATIGEAAYLANSAASVVVGKIGTAGLTSEELIESIHS
ncbi:D-glycero-beta-D-manno-heptose-7-phosphate kinase [Acidobacteriota bacterium]